MNSPRFIANTAKSCASTHSVALRKSVEYLLRALQLMMVAAKSDGQHYHGVVFLLSRHVAEEVDAASLLIAEGCVRPCKSHLRSALEAQLGVMYILEANHEQRALGYEVKHVRDQLRLHDKTDPNSDAGKKLRDVIKNDPVGTSVLSGLSSFDFNTPKARLEAALQREPLKSVNDEWQRLKKAKQRPSWHGLFDGPKTIRELAFHLNQAFLYEYLYSDWSEQIHAGGSYANIGKRSGDPNGQAKAIRPLRHPDGLRDVLTYGQTIAILVGKRLGEEYLSQIGRDDLRSFYMQEVRPLNEELKCVGINANWR